MHADYWVAKHLKGAWWMRWVQNWKDEGRGAPGKMCEGDKERVGTERSAQMASWRHFGWTYDLPLRIQPKDAVAFRSTLHYLFSAVLLIREEAAPERLSVEGAKSTGKSRTGLFTIKVWPEERTGWPQTGEASGEARGRSEVEGESWKEMISLYFALSGMG